MMLPRKSRFRAMVFLLMAMTPYLLAAEGGGCPMRFGAGSNPSTGSPQTNSNTQTLDLGGESGAAWTIEYEDFHRLVLHSADQIASTETTLNGQTVTLHGQPFLYLDFCARADTICPHQVLLDQTAIVQPANEANVAYVASETRGPMRLITIDGWLKGRLNDRTFTIPLDGAAPSLDNPCLLGRESSIIATALVESNSAPSSMSSKRVETLQGRITLVYSGSCIMLGGSGVALPEETLKFSVGFTATRN